MQARPHPGLAGRPDLTAYRDLESAYRIGLKSLARRYLELHDNEIADLDVMIAAIVDELAQPNLVARNSIGHIGGRPASPYGRRQSRKIAVGGQLRVVVRRQLPFRRPRERPSGIASTEAEIAQPTARCISSPSDAYGPTREPRTMLLVG